MNAAHFTGTSLTTGTYFTPGVSISPYMAPSVDFTATVAGWVKNAGTNHGFILTAAVAPSPAEDGTGQCLSGLGNFKLEINYFAP